MSSPYAALVARRARAWLQVLSIVEEAAARLRRRFGAVTVILYGSHARGDFNLWSDIDLIIISEVFRGVRPLDRYKLVEELLEPGIEAILLTPGEAAEVLRRTGWRYALRDAVIILDDYGLAGLVEQASGKRPRTLAELRRRIEGVLNEALGPNKAPK